MLDAIIVIAQYARDQALASYPGARSASVREIEMGSFTPLVFSATGGMAPAATIMYKRLASLLAEKRHQTYSKTISWLRCSIGFSLVRSAVMCLRGSRSSFHHPTSDVHMDVAISESRVPMIWTLNRLSLFLFSTYIFFLHLSVLLCTYCQKGYIYPQKKALEGGGAKGDKKTAPGIYCLRMRD